jgi:hypothetical protein
MSSISPQHPVFILAGGHTSVREQRCFRQNPITMAGKIKTNRKITASRKGEELTDELYDKLNPANQLVVILAESLGIDVLVSEYQGRYYIASDLVLEVADQMLA